MSTLRHYRPDRRRIRASKLKPTGNGVMPFAARRRAPGSSRRRATYSGNPEKREGRPLGDLLLILGVLYPAVSRVLLSWLKPFGTEHRPSDRSGEELDKRFRRLRCFGSRANGGGPECRAGQLAGKRAEHFRSRHGHNLRTLCDSDFGFALRNNSAAWGPGTKIVLDFNWSAIPRRLRTCAK